MQEVRIELAEPEFACLRELAEQAGITVEEAVLRAVRYVLKEAIPLHPQYLQFRSQMFWEHYRHLNEVLRREVSKSD